MAGKHRKILLAIIYCVLSSCTLALVIYFFVIAAQSYASEHPKALTYIRGQCFIQTINYKMYVCKKCSDIGPCYKLIWTVIYGQNYIINGTIEQSNEYCHKIDAMNDNIGYIVS